MTRRVRFRLGEFLLGESLDCGSSRRLTFYQMVYITATEHSLDALRAIACTCNLPSALSYEES